MGGSPFIVESTVNPGARIEISIKMVAPTNETGIVRGTWRMSDENGTLFGDAIYGSDCDRQHYRASHDNGVATATP